jgi:hypothetical protein
MEISMLSTSITPWRRNIIIEVMFTSVAFNLVCEAVGSVREVRITDRTLT